MASMEPDLILHNGLVTTLDAAEPQVEAVAIQGGMFIATGVDSDILKLRGSKTQVIDVGRRRVIPGLNDSHLHFIRGGLNYNMELRWDGVPSLADALRMLKDAGAADSAAAMGTRRWRMDGVPVRRTPHADARRDQ